MTTPDYVLDLREERLSKGRKVVRLGNRAFRVLCLFAANPNRLLTKDEILGAVWQDVHVSEGLVKEYVHDLRHVLGDDPRKPRFIETVRGRGYRFLGGIRTVNGPAHQELRTKAHPRALSLAVLPFTNLSDDPDQEYFADGISEDIIIGLSRNPHLSVISRNSSFSFKDRPVPVPKIASALGAEFVLVGSVRKNGRRVRISAELIDGESDAHIWTEKYDRELGDIFAIQDEVVRSIVHTLGTSDGAIERSARRRLSGTPEAELGAYDCYLKAQGHFYRRHGAGFDEAERLYQKAIELDPGFARAHSALAFLRFQRFKVYLTASFESVEQETSELARRALHLDPDDYLAHWVLGRLYSYSGNLAQGIAEFERAVRLNPSDANVLADFADYLVYADRADEALDLCRRAIRLNPKCPDWYWWHLGFAYFHLGRHEEARAALEHMTSPGQAQRLRAAVNAQLGRLDEARSAAEQFLRANPGFSINEWARSEPYADPDELGRYVAGLRKAGLPE